MHWVHGLRRDSPMGRSVLQAGCLLLLYTRIACAQVLTEQSQPFSLAYFSNGSSYVLLSDKLLLTEGALIGFSFRTCLAPSELLLQGDGESSPLHVSLTPSGSVQLLLAHAGQTRSLEVGSALADGNWHTVRVGVSSDSSTVCLSVDQLGSAAECNEPRTGPAIVSGDSALAAIAVGRLDSVTEFLSAFNGAVGNSSSSWQIRVGSGFVGCVREGPGVRLSGGKVADYSAVDWASCLLPSTCADYNWSVLRADSPDSSSCVETSCENGGLCLPRLVSSPADASPPASACICPAGYTGPACSEPTTSCSQTPCRHGGTCLDDAVTGAYSCNCDSTGYSGTHCEVELNNCVGDVCLNSGQCYDQPGGFLCDCIPPYYGATCQHEAIAAAPRGLSADNSGCLSYCQNGGVCSSTQGSPTCQCLPGFSGSQCETVVNPCANTTCPPNSECSVGLGNAVACICSLGFTGSSESSCTKIEYCSPSPCTNGGSCSDTGTGFLCSCPLGWEGETCERDVDECSSAPCRNGGSCTNGQGRYTCACPPGYEGLSCEVDVNECESSPCYHGECVDQVASYVCSCELGWAGQNCDVNLDECISTPCLNNGSCEDQVNGYLCKCPPGFVGQNCEVNIQECDSSPCLNNATCVDGVNSYTCQCTSSFMGTNCELRYDPCASEPCNNGATCQQLSLERGGATAEYSCTCLPGYDGVNCQNNIDDCQGVACPANQICFDLVEAHECRCPPGFQGADCSEDIDECAPGPCLNGGSCADLVGNYTCTCATGFTGPNCEEDVDECTVNPTICNNGICQNENGGYQCYCRPGYSGTHCNYDFNECLSNPCRNGGSCDNLVNEYRCTCLAGFNGTDCEHNIDECAGQPCQNLATCIDGINNYTCSCQPGFTGTNCEVDIDDCESGPCLNGGACVDGVNEYTCNCIDTGFTGANCQEDIDECAVFPCQNNATCANLVNDYACSCWDGFLGKNCETDFDDCSSNPCVNNGTCFARSNITLYESWSSLPGGVQELFAQGFHYANASGFLCQCIPGFEGDTCSVDINECESNPCKNEAECINGINEYTCQCKPGFTGAECQTNINECALYTPCENGAVCTDGIADYKCSCTEGYGGKNCSVELIGCQLVTCLNGGTCTPWLIGESEHKGNCSCAPGFDGDLCQITTTFSFKGNSFVTVESSRSEGFELSLRFRTTLSNGFIAIGQGLSFFTLQLNRGRLNLHSSMLSSFEGIFLGENLNDTFWQKVYVAVNISHLTIGLNDRLQAIHQINPDYNNSTAFVTTFLGGSPPQSSSRLLAKDIAEFIGCMQDISVNGIRVTEEDVRTNGTPGIVENNTEKGCLRKDQCNPNPCRNGGNCTDLWKSYKCFCYRPYLGPSCQYNYTGATFGYENTTNSQVVVEISNPRDYQDGVDLTMFIRTRKATGIIFYLGTDPSSTDKNQIIGRLVNGTLQVEAAFADKPTEYFKLYSAQLDNGYRHFIRVERMKNQMTVKVNETISIKQDLSSNVPIKAEKLYLGNLMVDPSTTTTSSTTLSPLAVLEDAGGATVLTTGPTTLPFDTTMLIGSDLEPGTTLSPQFDTGDEDVTEQALSRVNRQSIEALILEDEFDSSQPSFFKGVIQDVQLSNGTGARRIVELYELEFVDQVEVEPSLGPVTAVAIKKGVVSDNNCRINPCQNNGRCIVIWNDNRCECEPGYKGENCEEIEHCHWFQCPEGSVCNTLPDGHECVTNSTFNGVNSTVRYQAQLSSVTVIDSFSARFRTRENGTLFHCVKDDLHMKVTIAFGHVEIELPIGDMVRNYTLGTDVSNGEWHTISITSQGGFLLLDADDTGYDDFFFEDDDDQLDLYNFLQESNILLGSSWIVERNGLDNVTRQIEDPDHSQHFRGCVGEIRVGGMLLPYFTEEELVNNTLLNKFSVDDSQNMVTGDCILCYEMECKNGGGCANPGEEFDCQCVPGFEGSLCELNIDECALNSSCMHGVCEDLINEYVCKCDRGWVGVHCEEDKDECFDNPCINGGECMETVEPGDYICNCTEEYRGKNCEDLKIKTCSEMPCINGGTCINDPELDESVSDRYRCDCPQGYEGSKCENQIDFCRKLNVLCENGGTCVSDFSSFSYKCQCVLGFEGKNCDINVDDCVSKPCHNNGTCMDLTNSFHCDCDNTGFTGRSCDENINECVLNVCQNNGRCNDTIGDYECDCPEKYCGKNCQTEDPCRKDVKLCLNEGSCIPDCDKAPYFACSCPPGWEGPNCNLKSSSSEELALIVGPIVGGMAFIALVGLLIFLIMARRKRKGEGHYRPAKQELTSPRLQLDNMLKIPPEERLI